MVRIEKLKKVTSLKDLSNVGVEVGAVTDVGLDIAATVSQTIDGSITKQLGGAPSVVTAADGRSSDAKGVQAKVIATAGVAADAPSVAVEHDLQAAGAPLASSKPSIKPGVSVKLTGGAETQKLQRTGTVTGNAKVKHQMAGASMASSSTMGRLHGLVRVGQEERQRRKAKLSKRRDVSEGCGCHEPKSVSCACTGHVMFADERRAGAELRYQYPSDAPSQANRQPVFATIGGQAGADLTGVPLAVTAASDSPPAESVSGAPPSTGPAQLAGLSVAADSPKALGRAVGSEPLFGVDFPVGKVFDLGRPVHQLSAAAEMTMRGEFTFDDPIKEIIESEDFGGPDEPPILTDVVLDDGSVPMPLTLGGPGVRQSVDLAPPGHNFVTRGDGTIVDCTPVHRAWVWHPPRRLSTGPPAIRTVSNPTGMSPEDVYLMLQSALDDLVDGNADIVEIPGGLVYVISEPLTLGDHDQPVISNFIIRGVGTTNPVIKMRGSNTVIDESTLDINRLEVLSLTRCSNFLIEGVDLHGNRNEWPDEEEFAVGGGPASWANLRLAGCHDFWLENMQSSYSRGNGFTFVNSRGLRSGGNGRPDFFDLQNFCLRGVVRNCSDIFATDSSIAFQFARQMRIVDSQFSYAYGGDTCAGIQIETLTEGTADLFFDSDPTNDISNYSPADRTEFIGQTDFIVRGCRIEGNWKGIQINGRWGSGDVTITECTVAGGGANENGAIRADAASGTPRGGDWLKVYPTEDALGRQIVDAVVKYCSRPVNEFGARISGALRHGIVVAKTRRVRIGPNNSLERWDNRFYPASAMVAVSGGCNWIHDNHFQGIRDWRLWLCPGEIVPQTANPNQTLAAIFATTLDGPLTIERNRFLNVNPYAYEKRFPSTSLDLGWRVYFIFISIGTFPVSDVSVSGNEWTRSTARPWELLRPQAWLSLNGRIM